MKNFIQQGRSIEITAPYAATTGGGMLLGTLFGVVADTVGSGATAEIVIEGVFDIAKDASVFSAGDLVYWDDTNKVVTSTATGNRTVGRAIQAQLTGDATCRVHLNRGAGAVGGLGTSVFQSTEQTGTGGAQNVAHGLGAVPRAVTVFPTDLTPATLGSYVVTLGAHTTTNCVVTVTSGKKYMVVAIL
jgi:predicted RecA/RadA family phage recombinase